MKYNIEKEIVKKTELWMKIWRNLNNHDDSFGYHGNEVVKDVMHEICEDLRRKKS